MATRGARPKPSALRVVDGTHRKDRHGEIGEVTVPEAKKSPLVRPTFLKGEARKAWERWITPAWWVDWSRESAAIAFCELWAEFRESPINFNASRHGQMRAYAQELGLTDERNRAKDGDGEKDPGAKFFE